MHKSLMSLGAAALLAIGGGSAALGATAAAKCEAAKVQTAGKYAFCRLKADAKAIKQGAAPDYGKCDAKYALKWGLVESKGGGACPVNGDETAIQTQANECTDALTAAIGGTPPGGCPVDLAQCQTDWMQCLALLIVPPDAFAVCPGDCNADSRITVNELVLGVNIVLGLTSADDCSALDADGDGQVGISDLIAAVNRLLNGCPSEAHLILFTHPADDALAKVQLHDGRQISYFGTRTEAGYSGTITNIITQRSPSESGSDVILTFDADGRLTDARLRDRTVALNVDWISYTQAVATLTWPEGSLSKVITVNGGQLPVPVAHAQALQRVGAELVLTGLVDVEAPCGEQFLDHKSVHIKLESEDGSSSEKFADRVPGSKSQYYYTLTRPADPVDADEAETEFNRAREQTCLAVDTVRQLCEECAALPEHACSCGELGVVDVCPEGDFPRQTDNEADVESAVITLRANFVANGNTYTSLPEIVEVTSDSTELTSVKLRIDGPSDFALSSGLRLVGKGEGPCGTESYVIDNKVGSCSNVDNLKIECNASPGDAARQRSASVNVGQNRMATCFEKTPISVRPGDTWFILVGTDPPAVVLPGIFKRHSTGDPGVCPATPTETPTLTATATATQSATATTIATATATEVMPTFTPTPVVDVLLDNVSGFAGDDVTFQMSILNPGVNVWRTIIDSYRLAGEGCPSLENCTLKYSAFWKQHCDAKQCYSQVVCEPQIDAFIIDFSTSRVQVTFDTSISHARSAKCHISIADDAVPGVYPVRCIGRATCSPGSVEVRGR